MKFEELIELIRTDIEEIRFGKFWPEEFPKVIYDMGFYGIDCGDTNSRSLCWHVKNNERYLDFVKENNLREELKIDMPESKRDKNCTRIVIFEKGTRVRLYLESIE